MNSALTISLDLEEGLLVARVQGSADDLVEGERVLDAIHAGSVRVGAGQVLVDFGALGGAMANDYEAELEQYVAARFARVKCALVLPPDCVAEPAAPRGSRFAVFGSVDEARGWLRARRPAATFGAESARPAHTLVHLL